MTARFRYRWPSCLVMFAGAVFTVGCSMIYRYEMTGVIKNAVDGSPVAGVQIERDPGTSITGTFPVRTGPDGRFVVEFSVRDGEFFAGKLPKWKFTLSKAGFEDEAVEITPTKEPQPRTANQIVLFAFVRPTPPAAQPQQAPIDAPQNNP